MGVLKIGCFCDEKQMDEMEKLVVDSIYSQSFDCLSDIDRPFGDMRICVDFGKSMTTLELKAVEVLDADWDVLYEDSAVLAYRLKLFVNEYNKQKKASRKQALDIISDELNDMGK